MTNYATVLSCSINNACFISCIGALVAEVILWQKTNCAGGDESSSSGSATEVMRHSLFPSLSVAASPARSERPFLNIQSSGEEGRSTHGNKRKEKEEEVVTSPQRPKRIRSIRTMDGFEIEIEGSETREVSSKPQPEGIKNFHLFWYI
jgi:hypothetical protein